MTVIEILQGSSLPHNLLSPSVLSANTVQFLIPAGLDSGPCSTQSTEIDQGSRFDSSSLERFAILRKVHPSSASRGGFDRGYLLIHLSSLSHPSSTHYHLTTYHLCPCAYTSLVFCVLKWVSGMLDTRLQYPKLGSMSTASALPSTGYQEWNVPTGFRDFTVEHMYLKLIISLKILLHCSYCQSFQGEETLVLSC